MKKIKLIMDYQCYPVWVYNAQGELVCNDLIGELKNIPELKELLNDIQASYDSLFINDEVQFEYKGFNDVEAKSNFLSKVSRALQLIEMRVGNNYIVEDKVVV